MFWLFNVIIRVYFLGMYEMSLEGLKVDFGVLMVVFKDFFFNVWK